ncbi:hypothetical protein [Herpetosiphon geysericola]|uniref:hypothetical protein n=1 Tax=Herpetosiphon geysericola TaxID=70996 RepID=UPI00128F13BC|nr:hypothetical protein [Herpetosiphon geysericola]
MALQTSLNCWKHHARWALQTLAGLHHGAQTGLFAGLQKIGNSQMDLYLGTLTPAQINSQVLAQLDQHRIETDAEYAAWLASNDHYQLLTLSDSSNWVLRWGDAAEQRVHLHPARYSPLSVRVRAPVLRSAYALLLWQRWYGGDIHNLELVNQVRTTWLQLSPIAKLPAADGLGGLLALLQPLNALYL